MLRVDVNKTMLGSSAGPHAPGQSRLQVRYSMPFHIRCIAFFILAIALIQSSNGASVTLSVTFTNGTSSMLQYELPPADIIRAAASSTANSSMLSACCKPLEGRVSSFNTSFALYSGGKCGAAAKVCKFPAAVKSVWVCGCPGGRCYGKNNIESKSDMIGATDAAAAVKLSSEPLYRTLGYPSKVQVFSGSSDSASPCTIKGVKLEYAGGMAVMGQSGSALKVAQLANISSDVIVSVALQASSCLNYLEMRTQSGRVLQAGTLNKQLPVKMLAGKVAGSGLAGLAGFSKSATSSSSSSSSTSKAPLQALRMIWGYSHCPVTFGSAAVATASAAPMRVQVVVPPTAADAPLPTTTFESCGMTDPYCFTDDDCYCQLPNGTYGAACPMFGNCFGACCATTGVCPNSMGYVEPVTNKQLVLTPKTCSDWGLDMAGPLVAPASSSAKGFAADLECKLPKNRICDPNTPGTLCMGYTSCRDRDSCDGQLNGAMCVYRPDKSTLFDVCSCLPIFPLVDPSDATGALI